MEETRNYIHQSKVAPYFFASAFGNDKPYEGFCELFDNAIDAGATKIEVTYNSIKNELTVEDNGCGFQSETLKTALDYGQKPKISDDKIGSYNVGLKAVPYFFIRPHLTKNLIMIIDSVHNGKRVLVEKRISLDDNKENLSNNITEYPTFETVNGTKITLKGVYLTLNEYASCKNLLAARFCNLLNTHKVTFMFDNEQPLEGIDMFYSNEKDLFTREATIQCHDENGDFDTHIKIVELSSALKRKSEIGGNTTYIEEKLNIIDRNAKSKCSSKEHCGVYIRVGDIYLTMGGSDSFKHLGRVEHAYLNNVRVEITLPLSRKYYVDNCIKTATKKYLCQVMQNHIENKLSQRRGKGYWSNDHVFVDVLNWWKDNCPSKSKREEIGEDKNKAIRKNYLMNNKRMVELITSISNKVRQGCVPSEYKDEVMELENIIDTCSKGHKVA